MHLRNRIVMAPMTREFAPEGVPTAQIVDYYRRRAAGGTGLIITEGTPPDEAGAFSARVPRFHGAQALAGWQQVVDAVHAEGAAILAQLWHVGAFDPSIIGMEDGPGARTARVSPSGLASPDKRIGRAMTQAEIRETVEAYAIATREARRAGFDGIEIHGAHGYLPDQFLWRHTNERDDAYGGSLTARLRFAREIVEACREEAGEGLVISYRLSQWKQLDYAARVAESPEELRMIVEPLAAAGVDLFHCSTRRYWEPAFDGDAATLAAWVRRLSARPTITVGSITLGNDFKSSGGKVSAAPAPEQIEDIERRLVAGEFDLIALGRALLANPDWVRLVESGRENELRPFSKAQLDSLI